MLKWPLRGTPPPTPSVADRPPAAEGSANVRSAAIEIGARLRAERDRFVAFAFAGSDLLLEVDRSGRIRFAAGAAGELFGCDAQQLAQRRLADWVATAERPRLSRTLDAITSRRRVPPARFSLVAGDEVRPIWLVGCCLDEHVLHLGLRAVSADVDPLPTLPDTETFRSALVHRLASSIDDERLTLLDLPALTDPEHPPPAAERGALEAELARVLATFATGPDAAGWLGARTVGVVHGEEVDPAEIGRRLGELGVAGDPARGCATLALDPTGLTAEDAGQALLYAINKFAESQGREFTVSSLQDGLEAMVSETVTRLAAYRGTVSADAFDLAFQPIVDLKTRQVSHYEVLSRLPGDRSAFEMVNFAENVGLVDEFDLRVCQRAFEALAAAGKAGFGLALNLSGRTLESDAFARALLGVIDQHRTLARRITFELTESAEIKQPDRVGQILSDLRRRGFKISLDDFGSGAASFHYLRWFRFDYLKIDGSYIKSTDDRDQAILRGMVALCRELGVKSIAEMIETKIQADRLKQLQIDYGQGYLFGQPGPLPAPARAGV